MKVIQQLLLSCLVGLCLVQPVMAEVDRTLYEAVVPLVNESEAAQQQAIQAAFKQVITLVTGGEAVLDHPEIQAALTEASRYAVQYGEQQSGSESEPSKQLAVSFDPVAVRQLLKSNGFKAWDQQRAETLVWLIQEATDGKRQIFSSEDEEELVVEALQKQASQSHIPLILPIMDFEDSAALSEVDAWGLFSESINKASTRYQARSVLAGRIYMVGESQYSGRWVLLFQGQQYVESLKATSLNDFMKVGINLASNKLSGFYAKQQEHTTIDNQTATNDGMRLVVQGVQGLTAYASVSKFLEKLAAVNEVNLLEITETQAIFELTLKGGESDLQDELEASTNMQLVDIKESTEANPRQLVYQWLKE